MNVRVAMDVTRKALLPIVLVLVLMSNISCDVILSEAEGVVSDIQLEHAFGADYAVAVNCSIRNVGEEGKIQVTYRLTSSEGDWEKMDDLYFRAGETRNLKKLFPEPTIEVTDIRAYVKVYPRPTSSS